MWDGALFPVPHCLMGAPLLASFERWDSDDIETVELLNTATVKLLTGQYLEAVCARLHAPT